MDKDGRTFFLTEKVIKFSFGFYHTFERTEAFQMGFAYIGDDTAVRLYDFAEEFDFSRMIGAHLDDGKVVFRFQAEQGRGYADVVVQIT